MFRIRRRAAKEASEFINKTIIGLGIGLVKNRDFILNKELGVSTQDAMDALRSLMSKEQIAEAQNSAIITKGEIDKHMTEKPYYYVDYLLFPF